jgi:hypothetical protein
VGNAHRDAYDLLGQSRAERRSTVSAGEALVAIYQASSVSILADCDHGEGWLAFQWPDALFGTEGLKIDLEGFCSRKMPIRSGQGPPDFIELQRDSIRLRFSPALAKKLELDQDVEIHFSIDENQFRQLERAVAYLNGDDSE